MELEDEQQNKKWGIGLINTLAKELIRLVIHGLILLSAFAIGYWLLNSYQIAFFSYNPPIGFAFFIIVYFAVQPLLVGALNLTILRFLYKQEGWRSDFWITGLFLLLVFMTINLIIQTVAIIPFTAGLALAEIFLLSLPFGYVAKFSIS